MLQFFSKMRMKLKYLLGLLTIVGVLGFSFSVDDLTTNNPPEKADSSRIETFTFSSNGIETKGKVYIPAAYERNKNLPAIFLIDYTEQHFKLATDEFEKVVDGVRQIKGLDALVVSLENIPDVDAEPETFREHYELYRKLAYHVDGKYTNNSSRTFIGKGSEGGVVLMTLFAENQDSSVFNSFIVTDPSPLYTSAIMEMIENNHFLNIESNKKLHFSFSTSNDRAKCIELINTINKANLPWLEFKSIEYSNSTYENTYPFSFADGLEFIFNNNADIK